MKVKNNWLKEKVGVAFVIATPDKDELVMTATLSVHDIVISDDKVTIRGLSKEDAYEFVFDPNRPSAGTPESLYNVTILVHSEETNLNNLRECWALPNAHLTKVRHDKNGTYQLQFVSRFIKTINSQYLQ